MNASAILSLAASLLLGGVFLRAALPKLNRPRSFALSVVAYQVLPLRASQLYARLVPPLELLAALLLLAGTTTRLAAVILALLLASFILAVGLNLARGRAVDCGCYGTSSAGHARLVSPRMLLQDFALLGVALLVTVTGPPGVSLAPWSPLRLVGSADTIARLGPLALLAAILVTLGTTLALDPDRRRLRAREARGWRVRHDPAGQG